MAGVPDAPGNLVDSFEEAFQSCITVLTRDDGPNQSKDEIKAKVDLSIMHLIDVAKEMETFFLQKRLLLSGLKPELIVREETNDLKLELLRKDELLRKLYDKIGVWQHMLSDLHGAGAAGPSSLNPANKSPLGQSANPNVAQQPGQAMQMQGMLNTPQPSIPQHHMAGQPMPNIATSNASYLAGGVPGGMPLGQGPSGIGGQQMPFNHALRGQQPNQMVAGGLQGPLAFLEKTTSNIGMQDRR